jgi:hypothetical protein
VRRLLIPRAPEIRIERIDHVNVAANGGKQINAAVIGAQVGRPD